MSYESIHELSKEYFDARKKHIDEKWLGPKATLCRLVLPYSRHLKVLWEADIKSSRYALDKFRKTIHEMQVNSDDIKDYLIHLKTHNLRVSDRNHFLLLFASFTAALTTLIGIGGFSKIYSLIPIIIGVAAINERATLNTQKIVNDELIEILKREIDRKK